MPGEVVAASIQVTEVERPLNERLAYGGDLHSKVLGKLTTLADAGIEHIEQRYPRWDEVDHAMRMYIDLEKSAKGPDQREIDGKYAMPFQRAIMIPLTYANLMSRQVQKYSILTATDPIIHLEGTGPEDFRGARIHEAMIRWDNEQSDADLVLWQMSWDDERYGFSVLKDTWEEEYGWGVKQPELDPVWAQYYPPGDPRFQRQRIWTRQKEYYRWKSVDPRKYIPDPNVPIWNPQAGCMCGDWDMVSWGNLERNQMPSGPYFNVKAARDTQCDGGRTDGTGRDTTGDYTNSLGTEEGYFPVGKLTSLCVRLIPREWGLSSVTRQEIWHFAWWNDKVIVRAHPTAYPDGQFHYAVGQGDHDQHAPFTPGMGEQLDGLQTLSNWLAGSEVMNKIKLFNDSLVVDPSALNMRDILQPGPARHIRLEKEGQKLIRKGFKINDFYQQLRVQDVTASHLGDVQAMMGFAQRISAANDSQQGQIFSEKRTLGEVEQTNASSTQRIGTSAMLLDRQILKPIAYRHIMARQYFTSRPMRLRITGDLSEALGADSIDVYPSDLTGSYDYIPHTPTMAPDPARKAATWAAILQVLAKAPQLLQPTMDGKRIDPHAVFNEMVRAQGVRYFDQFYTEMPMTGGMPGQPGPQQGGIPAGMPRVSVVPDDVAQRQLEAGNVVPMGAGL